MRKYKKPLVEIERFIANVAVASCERVFDHTETKYDPQTITCLNGSTDTIFSSSNCSYVVTGVVYMEGGTYSSKDAAIIAIGEEVSKLSGVALLKGSGGDKPSSSYTLDAGWYVYWVDNDGDDHAGLATSSTTDIFSFSF